jgi:fatty acid desaturase
MLHLVLVNKELIQKQTYLFHLYHHASVSQLANRSSKEGMSRMLCYITVRFAFYLSSLFSVYCFIY